MTYTPPIPASWTYGTTSLLSDWTTQYLNADATIYFQEIVSQTSPISLRYSINQPSGAEMTFRTAWSTLNDTASDPPLQDVLSLSILGGPYDDGMGLLMYPPMSHPQNSNLYATDLVITPYSFDNTNSVGAGDPAPYREAICHVSFQTLPYSVANSCEGIEGGPFNCNFIETRCSASNQAFTIPPGYYVWADTAGPHTIGQSTQLGQLYTAGLSYVDIVCHRIPASNALSSFGGISSVQQYCGFVNQNAIFGAGVGQLFFDTVDQVSFGDWYGQGIYTVNLHMIYNPVHTSSSGGATDGWNNSLDSDGLWYKIVTKNGSNLPLKQRDFGSILTALIPPNWT